MIIYLLILSYTLILWNVAFISTPTSKSLPGRLAIPTVFGEALQPVGWNRLEPWRDYDFTTELAQLRMPLIPQPETFHEGAYHFPYESLAELQHTSLTLS
ncbi:hypothetical protein RSAG8_00502, partial [Rhizoctonia solani AG-8 WAC10335]